MTTTPTLEEMSVTEPTAEEIAAAPPGYVMQFQPAAASAGEQVQLILKVTQPGLVIQGLVFDDKVEPLTIICGKQAFTATTGIEKCYGTPLPNPPNAFFMAIVKNLSARARVIRGAVYVTGDNVQGLSTEPFVPASVPEGGDYVAAPPAVQPTVPQQANFPPTVQQVATSLQPVPLVPGPPPRPTAHAPEGTVVMEHANIQIPFVSAPGPSPHAAAAAKGPRTICPGPNEVAVLLTRSEAMRLLETCSLRHGVTPLQPSESPGIMRALETALKSG